MNTCPHTSCTTDFTSGSIWCDDCMSVVGCDHTALKSSCENFCERVVCKVCGEDISNRLIRDEEERDVVDSCVSTTSNTKNSYAFTKFRDLILPTPLGKKMEKWRGVISKTIRYFNQVDVFYNSRNRKSKDKKDFNKKGVLVICLYFACVECGLDTDYKTLGEVVDITSININTSRKKVTRVLGDKWPMVYPHQKLRCTFNKFETVFDVNLTPKIKKKLVQLLKYLEMLYVYFLSQRLSSVCPSFLYFCLTDENINIGIDISEKMKDKSFSNIWQKAFGVSLGTTKSHAVKISKIISDVKLSGKK